MKYQSALSLPALAACLVLLGPNFAAATTAPNVTASEPARASNAGSNQAMQMVPAQADLTNTLDSRNARVDQKVEATLNSKVELKNGPVLPKDTVLVGEVIENQTSNNNQPSVLTLRFTQADLKNGKTIPIKATIVGLYSAQSHYQPFSGMMTQTPNYWTPQTLQVDQINALHSVDLHSKIAEHNSGVVRSNKHIRFLPGTEFSLAIAERG